MKMTLFIWLSGPDDTLSQALSKLLQKHGKAALKDDYVLINEVLGFVLFGKGGIVAGNELSSRVLYGKGFLYVRFVQLYSTESKHFLTC